MSYSCNANIKQIINSHNKRLLKNNDNNREKAGCNCRNKRECPLPGECLSSSIIYQATVTAINNIPPQTYVGLTENKFKIRYANHKHSFSNAQKRTSTELSKYVWSLKDQNIDFSISWRILKHANPYSNKSNRCNLCLNEKYFIIFQPEMASLNRRNELVTACRHSSKFLLKNFK